MDLLLGYVEFDTLQAGDEIKVPVGAAVFAVGGGAQSDRLLLRDCGGNATILDLAQCVMAHGAGFPGSARGLQFFGPQQTPDMIGTEWWGGASGHRRVSFLGGEDIGCGGSDPVLSGPGSFRSGGRGQVAMVPRHAALMAYSVRACQDLAQAKPRPDIAGQRRLGGAMTVWRLGLNPPPGSCGWSAAGGDRLWPDAVCRYMVALPRHRPEFGILETWHASRFYVCPETLGSLLETDDGLVRPDGKLYPWLPNAEETHRRVPQFLDLVSPGEGQRTSLAMYDTSSATEIYRNFLAILG